MNKDDLDKDLNALICDTHTLFGDVEEMDKEEAVALLSDSGPAATVVREQVYAQIDSLVKARSISFAALSRCVRSATPCLPHST